MFGWVVSNVKLVLYGLGVAALAIAVAFIRKSGADAEKLKQAQADAKVASTIGKARIEARTRTDEDLNKEIDRWSRK